jgi:hypothetical protein
MRQANQRRFRNRVNHNKQEEYDAVVVRGGFYGVNIALSLANNHGLRRILMVEQESEIMTRASKNNQARVHEGYHYPRSLTTAFRSKETSKLFQEEWSEAINFNIESVYAISSTASKISTRQYQNFMNVTGLNPRVPSNKVLSLFDLRRVDEVFVVDEKIFDWRKLRSMANERLQLSKVLTLVKTRVISVITDPSGKLMVEALQDDGQHRVFRSPLVFNCTYSGVSEIIVNGHLAKFRIKHELAEMPLVEAPTEFQDIAITIMDGPFFSLVPYPDHPGKHTLSHVLYTPLTTMARPNEFEAMIKAQKTGRTLPSNFEPMRRDAMRFVPALAELKSQQSIYEIKTVLLSNETDDGRPILFQEDILANGLFNVLGGKIDNVEDAIYHLSKVLDGSSRK